jgi:ABC-type multidrug transport system ATPase subunit
MSKKLLDARQIILINDIKPLFKPISFNIVAGQHYQLVGMNGSGKSSLLNAIHSSIYDHGHIDYSISKKRIGYLPHSLSVYQQLTLLEQIELFKHLTKVPDYFDWCFETLIQKHLMHRTTLQMSQGERQRAALILVLCFSIELILLDEPYSHQDAEFKEKVMTVIKYLTKHNIAVIETVHKPYLNNDNVIKLESHL